MPVAVKSSDLSALELQRRVTRMRSQGQEEQAARGGKNPTGKRERSERQQGILEIEQHGTARQNIGILPGSNDDMRCWR